MSAPNPNPNLVGASCPLPLDGYDQVTMGHGGGGRLTQELVSKLILPPFGVSGASLEDQARIDVGGGRIAVTTDSFVVRPIFFPGGNIGDLAVNGTINDLAVGGAIAKWIAVAFILEEGLPLAELQRVVEAMARRCSEEGVALVTGDTKVVDRGKGDKIFITTTGVGVLSRPSLSITNARPGDRILVSGSMGDHGIAILSVREGLAFETELVSDTAPLTSLAQSVLVAAPSTRLMRDPTRGGLASTLNELAAASNAGVALDETRVPVKESVRGACEILGLDPLYVANEGKLVAVVPADEAAAALRAMRAHPLGRDAADCGEVVEAHKGIVTARSPVGGERVVPLLSGEQLPRIC